MSTATEQAPEQAAPPAADAAEATEAPAANKEGEGAQGAQGGENAKDGNLSGTSLYVGDLDPSVSEAQLYELFNQFGHVVSIRVCRDLITRRSLGYAYVNFSNVADARQAMEMLNYAPLNGKPMRIMYSQRDPSQRKSGVGNIFIKNLDKSIDNKELHDTFAQFGNITSAKIMSDGSGVSKGFGFVQFDSEEAAQKAIDKVHGKLLRDKVVYVAPFVRRLDRSADKDGKFCNIYVKNIPEDYTDEKLKELFESVGETTSVAIMKGAEGKSKGFGFINYEDPDHAAAAVEKFDGHQISEEKTLVVCRAQKKSEREAQLKAKFDQERKERAEKFAGANLYLKNLTDTVDDAQLRELFNEFGTIISCKIMKDPAGTSRGSGFVAFSSPEEATRAVTEMNGKMVKGKPLYVALAQRKEERQARLKAQFTARTGLPAGLQPGMQMYPGGPAVAGNQMYFPPQVGMPPQPGMYPTMMHGVRPGAPGLPQYFVPMMQGNRQQGRNRNRGPQQMGRGNRGVRMNPNMRNQGEAMGANQVPLGGQQESGNGTASLAAQLAQASPDQQRIIIGEALYPLVEAVEPTAAAKVTGMLLEMDQSEVLHLIEDQGALNAKVGEAMHVLRQAGQAPAAE
ncbi:polyadenylate-binding protein [Chloropicon primus]|uniref:Polyadenylate-binding protein n=1 Tax=Chloropicon primus TaxID=1764295 RepID=A0A5B8MJW7_9CHLO|nr:polyadenylate-binding protein [Chloropicon primus]UPQ98864.1 polyadenylate-binding protein [Chloropicon primus]|mmetsp:Transcript_1312/g.3793  ORF Transcript_1312/g.3793 Transcript_1312/m.3793 type:complete len:624 (-) Transcript_1312:2065-3936(-)|eukprot:QDZ19652.1 polyadenylate-binding protein [Chloropicon primus]